MKRSLLALAVSASIVAPTVALADGPKVYGRMDLSLDNVSIDKDLNTDNDSGSSWEVTSNASRFGVKGDAELTDGLKAIYKIEWEVDGDGDSDTLKQRNRYVGLKGGFGSVLLGKMDTPLKQAQGKVDLFSDHAADIKSVVEGELRASNVVEYVTPKIAGAVTAKLALLQQEENEATDCDNKYDGETVDADDCEDGLFDAYSASVAFSQGGLYAAFALDNNVKAKMLKGDSSRVDTKRLVLAYKMDALKLGFLYSDSEENSDHAKASAKLLEQTGYVLSGAYTIGKTVLKAQYGASETEEEDAKDDLEITMIALGVDQKFSKQTKVFAEYTMLDSELGKVEPSRDTFSVGIQHKF